GAARRDRVAHARGGDGRAVDHVLAHARDRRRGRLGLAAVRMGELEARAGVQWAGYRGELRGRRDGHGDHRLASSALEIWIASAAPWPEVEELVGEAERECPVCRAIAGNVAMTVSLAPLA